MSNHRAAIAIQQSEVGSVRSGISQCGGQRAVKRSGDSNLAHNLIDSAEAEALAIVRRIQWVAPGGAEVSVFPGTRLTTSTPSGA